MIDDASLVNLECSGPYSLTTCFQLPPLTYGYIEIPFDVSDTPSEERKAQLVQHDVRIIPNPAMGSVQFLIDEDSEASIFLFNSQGVCVDQWLMNGRHTHSLDGFPPGLYTIKVIFSNGKVQTEKLVVL